MDGFYEIRFRSANDFGIGLLIFKDGLVTGIDVAGVSYDGSYRLANEQTVEVTLTLTVPPGVMLVQGTPAQPREYKITFTEVVSIKAFTESEPALVNLPPGPVYVIFKKLRDFNAA